MFPLLMPMFVEYFPVSVIYSKVVLEIHFKISFIRMSLIHNISFKTGGLKIFQKCALFKKYLKICFFLLLAAEFR